MIVHDTKHIDVPVGHGASLVERGEKASVIQVVAENRLTVVATIHHMVNPTGIFDGQLAGHDKPLIVASQLYQ